MWNCLIFVQLEFNPLHDHNRYYSRGKSNQLYLKDWLSKSESPADYVERHNQSKFGERRFSYAGPAAWNSLPHSIKLTIDTDRFKRLLKRLIYYTVRQLAAAQCIVIGPVCGFLFVCGRLCGSATTITRNCVHRSSPNWVSR